MILNTEILKHNLTTIPIVFLHGFTGSVADWVETAEGINNNYTVYAIDLPGHGKNDSTDDITLYSSAGMNRSIIETLEHHHLSKIILAGYSMGGRAALNFTVNHPEYIQALILESTSPGIRNFEDRTARVLNDEKIASMIKSGSMEKFVDYWMNLPLFESLKSLPGEKWEAARSNRLKNSKAGLANSLKGFGTGVMPVLWAELKRIRCRVLLITGEYDEKFTNINKEMSSMMKNAEHHIVPHCGHNVHLERPEHFINLVNNFCSRAASPDANFTNLRK